MHEFGHVFANLADEYVPSNIPWGAQNCANECGKFGKFGSTGCYLGCSEDDFYRSSENSVMRTLRTDEYGDVNTQIINKNLKEYE